MDSFDIVDGGLLIEDPLPDCEENDGEVNSTPKRQPKAKASRDSSYQSIESWVNAETNKECVKFFKPQNTESEKYPEIEYERFCLFLMTKPQIDFLKTFSQRLLCVDYQTGESFTLLTLLVLDDREQCLPCAFFLTEYLDSKAAEVFFIEIANMVGSLNTNLLLSDCDVISGAWDEVMGPCERHMICSWDVIKDWELNLPELRERFKMRTIMKELENLVRQKDINDFTTIYPTLLQSLENNPETEEFARYLSESYLDSPQTWACCYRFEDEGTQGFSELDKVHAAIEYILNSKPTKPIIKALNAVLDYLRCKIYDRLLVRSESKVSSKMYEMGKRHKAAGQMAYDITNHGDYWSVINGKKEQHSVKVSNLSCRCQLKCPTCKVCAHSYTCSCVDSMLKLTMCRHIHAVCICEDAISKGATTPNNDGSSVSRGSAESLVQRYKNLKAREVYGNQKLTQRKILGKSPPIKIVKIPRLEKSVLERAVGSGAIQTTNREIRNVIVEPKSDDIEHSEVQELYQNIQTSLANQCEASALQEILINEGEEINADENYEYEIVSDETVPVFSSLQEPKVGDDYYEYEIISDETLPLVSNEDVTKTISTKEIKCRKDNVEKVFKSILNQANSEDQVVLVENAVLSLQKSLHLKNEENTSMSKRKICSEQISLSSSSKYLKVCGINGKPLEVGQPVLLKFVE